MPPRPGSRARSLGRAALAAAALGWVGCSGDPDGGTTDAGPADGGLAEITVAEPTPPVLTPCPDGWAEADVGGFTACEPWAAGAAPDCGAGQARFTGDEACGPLGAACPAGAWPEGLPAEGVLYVQPGLSTEGDGSRDDPFATIARALSSAGPGTVVALGKGVASEAVVLPAGVSLVGACAAESRLAAPVGSGDSGAVTVREAGAVLRDVGLGGERAGIVVDGGSLEVDGVEVEGAREYGILVRDGGTVTGGRVTVRGTRVGGSGVAGAGVAVFGGATMELTAVTVEGSVATGLWMIGEGTRGSLTRAAIGGTRPQPDGRYGQGVDVSEGAALTMSDSAVERNVSGGLVLTGAGTSLELRDSVVRDHERSTDGRLGRGLSLSEGARADVERASVLRSEEVGAFALGAGSEIVATHLIVTGTRGADGDEIDGFGLGLEDGARAEVRHGAFVGNQTAGISTRAGSSLLLADVVVRGTRSRTLDRTLGQGVHLEHEATLERVLVEDNRQAGLVVVGSTADARVSDLTVRGTRSQEGDGTFGRGIYVGDGARAAMMGALVEDNQETGIGVVGSGTVVSLARVIVRGTSGEEASGQFGVGLVAQGGASVTVETARLSDNREVGISARGDGTTVQLTDVEVRQTRERDCVTSTCPTAGIGVGLGAYTGAHLEARGFTLHANALAGVQLSEGGAVDLHDGVVSSHPIGANVQVPDFDVARLNDDVVYLDNDRNLDRSGLPLPEPSTGL